MKRDEGGRYREAHASAASRGERAREETQTHEGLFTHSRSAAERRMKIQCATPQSKPFFKNKLLDRTGFKPNVVKG